MMNRRGFFGALFGAAAAPAMARFAPKPRHLLFNPRVNVAMQYEAAIEFLESLAREVRARKFERGVGSTIYIRKPPRFRNADGSVLVFAGSGRERPDAA